MDMANSFCIAKSVGLNYEQKKLKKLQWLLKKLNWLHGRDVWQAQWIAPALLLTEHAFRLSPLGRQRPMPGPRR